MATLALVVLTACSRGDGDEFADEVDAALSEADSGDGAAVRAYLDGDGAVLRNAVALAGEADGCAGALAVVNLDQPAFLAAAIAAPDTVLADAYSALQRALNEGISDCQADGRINGDWLGRVERAQAVIYGRLEQLGVPDR